MSPSRESSMSLQSLALTREMWSQREAVKRLLLLSLLFGFLLSVAGCGTTPSPQVLPLPSVPSGLLERTDAPAPLRSKTPSKISRGTLHSSGNAAPGSN